MRLRTLTRTSAATTATAVLGSLVTRDVRSGWYAGPEKPAFQPPAAALPLGWKAV